MKNFFETFYKNKKVLVTGHTGFKGGWLSVWLESMGAEVIGYSLVPSTAPCLFDITQKTGIQSVIGDIRDEMTLNDVFQKFKPEIVFHLAAQPLVRYSYTNPKQTYETNVMGTLNLLESCKKADNLRSVVVITSDKCYENKEWVYGYREIDPMGGYDPYSSSKGATEILTASYRSSFFNPKDYKITHNKSIATARAGNVIGGGDWAEDRLVPDCVRALSQSKEIIIRNPHSIRPWQHVLEPLSGYMQLAALMYERPTQFCEGWNFGPDESSTLTTEQIVKRVIKNWGAGSYNIQEENALHEANLLKLDTSKSKAELKWRPMYCADEAVEKTISWYKEYYTKKTDMVEFTKSQIAEYMFKLGIINKHEAVKTYE